MNPLRTYRRPVFHLVPAFNLAVAAILCVLPAYANAADKKAPPPRPAAEYPAVDTHPNEKVSIAIDPCNDPKDCPFFRLPYVRHSLIPIRIIITNDSDTALSLDEARFQFISANNDKIPAATPEDLNRRLFNLRDTQGTKIPLIPITIHHAPVDKKILQDDDDFGFHGTIVNAHSTAAGYLFYDLNSLDDPPLKHAELYVKMIHTLDMKKELFAFTIPFEKWLKTQTPPPKPITAPEGK